VEPLGLLCTAAAFRRCGVETTIVDLDPDDDRDELVRGLRGGEFGLIGIALSSQLQVWGAVSVARDAKCICPHAKVVVGGVFATMNSRWILDICPEIDGVCRGEGEMLAQYYADEPRLMSGLLHVVDRSGASVLTSPPRLPKYAETMDEYPLPARDLLPTVMRYGELPSVITSRGCGATCSFCAIPAFSGMLWRMRSVGSIVDEVRQLHRDYGATRFHLIDDNLFGHTEQTHVKAVRLLDGLAAIPERVEFRAACRIDDVTPGALPKIKAAGITLLKLGVETLGEATQRHYKKLLPEDIVAGRIEDTLRAGIGISLGFIMFDPFCDMATIRRNFNFLLSFPQCWSRHLLRSRLEAYAGTAIEQHISRAGLAVSKSAFGTVWKFQDKEVKEFHDRFAQAARRLLLPVEWTFYAVWRRNMRMHAQGLALLGRDELREIDTQIREISVDLFKQALAGRGDPVTHHLAGRAAGLKQQLDHALQESDRYAAG
jgi:hypothetical protein